MPKFTFRQLEYFRTIAMNGSISAASEQDHVSRSALAAAMDELERSLECQLFVRHKSQGMVLTPAGEQVLGMAHDLLNAASDLETTARGGNLNGNLAFGCFTSLGPTLIPRLFDYFRQQHPGVTLRSYTEPLDKLLDLLRTGEIEMAVSYNLDADPILQTEPLYNARLHAILPVSHPLASADVVDAATLAAEPLILLDTPPSPEFVRSYFAVQGLTPNIQHRFKNFEVIRSLVARGVGYSLVIQRPAIDLSYEGLELVARPLNPRPREETVSCAWPSNRKLSPNARAALDGLRAVARPVHSLDPYSP
ncbi:LysR family transcriptional regulator [Pseudarthrobacter sp. NBSH8]|uniref:LysR family transcriptional regulator n=1 Tax=Pseudarthrobacter sp. NBSH8 TaxID=2596911 RepID=UPI001624B1DA|nr:LysR family transcriptional regulator [Pseudarthrobacter sp. NBSH8]QNE14382.1 LysR family transcriptional regulator [Pseudarthrobacter sp. NBSH8]